MLLNAFSVSASYCIPQCVRLIALNVIMSDLIDGEQFLHNIVANDHCLYIESVLGLLYHWHKDATRTLLNASLLTSPSSDYSPGTIPQKVRYLSIPEFSSILDTRYLRSNLNIIIR